ncbi:MAG: TOBE domain-containing protein, partial [Pseudomonadota bacterium]
AADRLCGTVEEVVYKGPHEEIYVGVTGLPPILVQRRAGIGMNGDPFAIGDPVHLTVAADAILIFDKEEV